MFSSETNVFTVCCGLHTLVQIKNAFTAIKKGILRLITATSNLMEIWLNTKLNFMNVHKIFFSDLEYYFNCVFYLKPIFVLYYLFLTSEDCFQVDFGLMVKILNAGWSGPWQEDVLLLVPGGCVVHRPFALLIKTGHRYKEN